MYQFYELRDELKKAISNSEAVEESEKALTKILKGAYFDLFLMYDFGGWCTTFQTQMRTLDIASQNDKVSEKCETDIADLIEAYKD